MVHPSDWRDYEVEIRPEDLEDLARNAAIRRCSQTQYLRLLIRNAMAHGSTEPESQTPHKAD
jgi:hypothetical protein